jgi:hypothetical protein
MNRLLPHAHIYMLRALAVCWALLALQATTYAQTKISALPSATPASTDVVPFVANPGGTPVTKKTTVLDFFGVLAPSMIASANRQGTGAKFQLFGGGSVATNDCAKFDASGNVVSNGGSCAAAAPVQSVFGRTGAVVGAAADVGLGSVTNDAQTKAAVVPNTLPSSGQIPVGNAGGTAYAPQSVSGDGTLSSAGALTVTKVNGSTPGGTCTNQFVRSLSSSAVPSCASVAIGADVSGLGTGVGSFLGTPSSANLRAALTDETGTGAAVFAGGNIGAATATSLNFGGTTLSTYTEGTWTPTLNFNNATTGITYSVQIGRYTQIGNRVWVECRITLSSKGSATGAATITGLPVAASSTAGHFQVNTAVIAGSFTGVPYVYLDPTATSTIKTGVTSNGVDGGSLTDANFTNTSTISFSFWYATS